MDVAARYSLARDEVVHDVKYEEEYKGCKESYKLLRNRLKSFFAVHECCYFVCNGIAPVPYDGKAGPLSAIEQFARRTLADNAAHEGLQQLDHRSPQLSHQLLPELPPLTPRYEDWDTQMGRGGVANYSSRLFCAY